MPFGTLTNGMLATIQPQVVDLEVWDLGAGDLGHAHTLLGIGAMRIIAVDKSDRGGSVLSTPGIEFNHAPFKDIDVSLAGIRVAFLSWPMNYRMPGLIGLLERSERVIYLGSNTDGCACGWPDLFHHFLGRELVAHVPHKKNSLLVLGDPLDEPRASTPEEYAALSGEMMTFDRANLKGISRFLPYLGLTV